MSLRISSFCPAVALALLATPLAAWADHNPDFDDDAKPILSMQPGLVQYVENTFEVKDTGTAKIPGTDDRRPMPPYIFRARPRGSGGPFNLRLLIQPGPSGHILGVVDMTRIRLSEPGNPPPAVRHAPSVANQPAPEPQAPAVQQPTSTPSQPPTQQPVQPTADTPSGPIMSDSGGQTTPSSTSPSLAPPPDPTPATTH